MKRLATFRKQVIEGWTVQRIAFVLIVVGVVIGLSGFANKYCTDWCVLMPSVPVLLSDFLDDFYANVSVDCLSIAFAILVIDRLNKRRAEEQEKSKEQQLKTEAEAQLKAQLIREMGSQDNGVALRAVEELRAHGWLMDGSLRGTTLHKANLQGSGLRFADLQGVRFFEVNLEGADLLGANLQETSLCVVNFQRAKLVSTNLRSSLIFVCDMRGAMVLQTNLQDAHVQLTDFSGAFLLDSNLQGIQLQDSNLRGVQLGNIDLQNISGLTDQILVAVAGLRGATLPTGKLYNGCFNLIGEPSSLLHSDVDTKNPMSMADYYGVSLEDYLAGQEWAREHLADLRCEAGLDSDTGLPVGSTNGTEPQPADAPAPRRNGHKASMVSHRVRR